MGKYTSHRIWIVLITGSLIFAMSGCFPARTSLVQDATATPPASSETGTSEVGATTAVEPSATPKSIIPQTADSTPTADTQDEMVTSAADQPIAVKEGVLYQDDFSNPKSGWPESVKFENYFIGYHEPSFFHVDVHAPNDRSVVGLQDQTFTDFTIESTLFTEPNNTATDGTYRYGLVFRRSGGQYYAFTINPIDQTWQLLKVSQNATQELKSGSQATIRGIDGSNDLRVDVKGTIFYLWINDKIVGQASDINYKSGEVGFIVETFDCPHVHIHYDTLTVREVETISDQTGVLYQDDFTDPESGWPKSVKFDNYFIGYHEPSYFHVDVHAPNDRVIVSLQKQPYTAFTLESKMFTDLNNTAPEGNYRYGLVFRRSGGQYYAFAISPIDKGWQLLKVTPEGTQELLSGTKHDIQGRARPDTLRVDAQGTNFFLWIDNQLVSQSSDSDFSGGEVGFFVETFDIPRVHIHYDTITVREAQIPQYPCEVMVNGLNLREGPSIDNDVIVTTRYLNRFTPLARSPDNLWLQVRFEDPLLTGWVSNSSDYFTCSVAVDDLPFQEP